MASDGPEPSPTAATTSVDIDDLSKRLFEIYTTRDIPRQVELVKSVYAEDAVFQDNVAYAKGLKGLVTMWQGLPKLFPKVEVEVFSKDLQQPAQQGEAPGAASTVTIKNCQTYDMAGALSWMAGKQVKLPVTTTLQLDAQGKVIEHMDRWEGRGTMPAALRKAGGAFTNFMLRCSGAKKA